MKAYFLAALLIAGTTACTRTDQTRSRTEEQPRATEETRARTPDDRSAWERSMQDRMDRLERQIDEVKQKAKDARARGAIKTEREYDERVSELERLRDETKEKYNQAKRATSQTWQRFKDEVEEAANRLENAWDRFMADVRK
ncbi:MAG: hypothetical protein HYZ57_19300 [Acidobacteria bacterium]|nr:hypothetical protein [Acidobacteriota bacterium]MBI3281976.1 hypothetical protein [Acidobacteriota bacterium]